MRNSIRLSLLAAAIGIACTGCHHKIAAVNNTPATPTKPAASPTATLSVIPETVERGQTAQLTWSTENASSISIDGVGTVAASGSRQITAEQSTTYHLLAQSDAGSAEANARLTVTAPKQVVDNISDEQLFAQNVKDIFFSYDNAEIRNDEQALLDADAKFLAAHPSWRMLIEGHCDERGSEDYNLALGQNRARQVRDSLVHQGIGGDRIKLVSLGKEKPFCTTAENESCWSQNRRAHFVLENTQRAGN